MSTSVFEGVILYDPADVGEDRFASEGIVRDGVINSALHKADEAAQVRGAWVAPNASIWTDDSDPFLVPHRYWSNETLVADQWAPFPLRGVWCPKVRASGAGYRLRIWLAGRSSAGHSCDFAVVVRALGSYVAGEEPAAPQKLYSNVVSTTAAALTADDTTLWLDVPARIVDEALARGTVSTLTDTGGDAIAAQVPMLELVVMAKTANLSSTPELHGFVWAEVIGDS